MLVLRGLEPTVVFPLIEPLSQAHPVTTAPQTSMVQVLEITRSYLLLASLEALLAVSVVSPSVKMGPTIS